MRGTDERNDAPDTAQARPAAATAPIDPAALSDIIERIYDCAIDRTRWPPTLGAIGEFLQGNRPRIFLFDVNPQAALPEVSLGVDHDFNRVFGSDLETLSSIKYGFVVGALDEAATLGEILGTQGGRDINGRVMSDNRFYREWMAPRGAHDALAALIVKTARRFGGIALTRSSPAEPFGAVDKEKVRLLGPHIRRALLIADIVGERSVERDRFAEIIDALTTPIAIADTLGRLVHANEAARHLFAQRTVMTAEHDVLRPLDPESSDLLRTALAAKDGQARSVPLLATGGGAGVVASVLPLGSGPSGPSALSAVFFHQPERTAELPGEAFAKLYRLTGAELRILMLLAEGETVPGMSERTGSSIETIRWHVKNLLVKTGAARQSDLVRLAAMAISPIRRT